MSKELENKQLQQLDTLYEKAVTHINMARETIQRTVDTEMVKAYWMIGRDIVEEEQQGKSRAEYGSKLLTSLSARLNQKYKKGFSISTLRDARQFYLTYTDHAIQHAVRGESVKDKSFSSNLGWIHYRALMRVGHKSARQFYEVEAQSNNWSGRELERQIGSLLFERIARSKDQEELLQLALEGQEISTPEYAIKDPMILEFLGLPEPPRLIESELEQALIDNLQSFLLELGKGFSFIKRQQRLSIDGDHFYADLVFYHVVLKCYVIIDIKTKPLSHADLGKIKLYVNYFDKKVNRKLYLSAVLF
jgi:predicted nuclease of restriction endonuclease-like (RecB) superfamily